MDWLLFLPQLPASPSTLRVNIWRRMRSVGALGFQNGVWILPRTPDHRQFLEKQITYLTGQGAAGFAFEVTSLNPSAEADILDRFRSQRNEEYAEFCERCDALLSELEKETVGEKFSFAELEETEVDIQKLENWLSKITARDFVEGSDQPQALDKLARCQEAHREFADRVYRQQGIGDNTL